VNDTNRPKRSHTRRAIRSLADFLFFFAGIDFLLFSPALTFFPFRLHRRAGAGASGAYQVLDDKNPVLYHVYVTFSLEICNALMRGDIIFGRNVDTKKFLVAYPSYQKDDDDEEYDDNDDEEYDDNDDEEHDNKVVVIVGDDDDVDSPPAAGFSTSPSICATPASVGKRPMSPKQAAPVVKRLCLQASLSSFFPKAIPSTSKGSDEGF
jgi:hypothetical protein